MGQRKVPVPFACFRCNDQGLPLRLDGHIEEHPDSFEFMLLLLETFESLVPTPDRYRLPPKEKSVVQRLKEQFTRRGFALAVWVPHRWIRTNFSPVKPNLRDDRISPFGATTTYPKN